MAAIVRGSSIPIVPDCPYPVEDMLQGLPLRELLANPLPEDGIKITAGFEQQPYDVLLPTLGLQSAAVFSQEQVEGLQTKKFLGMGSGGMAYEAGLPSGKIVPERRTTAAIMDRLLTLAVEVHDAGKCVAACEIKIEQRDPAKKAAAKRELADATETLRTSRDAFAALYQSEGRYVMSDYPEHREWMLELLPETLRQSSQSPTGRPDEAVVFSQEDFEGFQTKKCLGKGSSGTAYEAGLRSGKIVCVKVVELGSKNLKSEIELMKKLNHPNIVQYYGCTEDNSKSTINIFMECVTGGTMNHYIKRLKTPPRDTVRQWAFQIVSGIKYLHDLGIVHRDIKGDNVLITMDGIVKLADFGCSKQIDDLCSRSRGCQTIVGTSYWMAPEVIKGERYGTKSDIWSVACTIVEMVTGKPPWPECNLMWVALYKIANSKGLPTEIPKDLGEDMMDFLQLCFQRDPVKRPTAEELLQHRWIAEFSLRKAK